MRVVGGVYRHRELVWPKQGDTRPSKDMVREAIFNVLMNQVENKVVLDLFAGSGAYAIEAISRGAKFIYLVDNSSSAIKAIKENLVNLKIKEARVYLTNYLDAIYDLKKKKIKIDLLFLDPPYRMNDYQKLINEVKDLLSEHAIIVIESDTPIKLDFIYQKTKEYRYGKTWVNIIWR